MKRHVFDGKPAGGQKCSGAGSHSLSAGQRSVQTLKCSQKPNAAADVVMMSPTAGSDLQTCLESNVAS